MNNEPGPHHPSTDTLFAQLQRDPLPNPGVLHAAASTLRTVAGDDDYDHIVVLARSTTLGAQRTPLLAWLIDHGGSDGLDVVVDQLADPSVRIACVQLLRRVQPTPTHLIERVEPYLNDRDETVRSEALRTINLLYLAIFALDLSRA
ncbi:sister chromatid cohesion protein PDS5 (plasmid) [Gordonia amicalis]|nr:sister chromatid cohesion protein PDS5 [Gordonia amicalis]UOG23804.1 sister chromatid cohesion protein PDS5 [Gordonia amicalis]